MKYNIKELNNINDIMNNYHVNSLLAKVIDSKNIDLDFYKNMINNRLIYHDFSLFSEGEMALDRINEAISNNEKICIYGDYDCDGILATSILVNAFNELDVEVGYHIPNRFTDGYGLTKERVIQMHEKGYSLIITVDNGIKAFEAVEKANELGIDVIITDHHAFDNDNYPDALSIIHTKLSQDYPFKEICGGFIAYKLAAALLGHQDKYLYCLAAITTISDMMPLLDENRSVVKRGLMFMKENHYPQLEALINSQDYSATTIGFTIAPKINSFGRLPEMVNPNNLVKYFQKDVDPTFMYAVAKNANQINSRRQSLTNKMYNEALDEYNESYLFYGSSSIHEGVVGLIAGKYAREFEKPAFVMHYDEESKIYKGSARGVEGFNIYDFFLKHEDLLIQFGGHAMAGGFSLKKKSFDLLKEKLEEDLEGLTLENSQDVISLSLDDLTVDNVLSLEKLEPFGVSNESPLFIIKDFSFDNIRLLSNGKHLKFDKKIGYDVFSALYFFKGDFYETIKDKNNINIVGTLSINEYQGKKSVNMIISDIIEL